MALNEKKLGKVITAMADSFDKELYSTKEDELDKEYWHFKWNNDSTDEWNTYQFYDMLKLYNSFVRRWEEKHNGTCCVVERVRDKYLMPKIKEFVKQLKEGK